MVHRPPLERARRQAELWRFSRPDDARQLLKIAGQPQADWFGDWNAHVLSEVRARVSEMGSVGALPVLVAYNLPLRDGGGYSAGGAESSAAYRSWIGSVARGIGSRRAVVILEPDALAGLDCLTGRLRRVRLSLLRHAIAMLERRPGVSVYLDAGNSRWHPAPETAGRLRQAGVGRAQGFALNVSNFLATAGELGYGRRISPARGGKHFVVDTSRNGLGPAPGLQWCNPPGRALGARPTARTGEPRADAFLWIKPPDESDGACGRAARAGAWWPEYAVGLAQRAAY